jgi:tetratricopeptide (TPR) repeat protein
MADHDRVRDFIRDAHRNAVSGNRERALELVRKALALDPDERVITETILAMEQGAAPAKPRPAPVIPDPVRLPERTDPMAIDPKLEKALDLSEQCRRSGDNAKALAYLKKAKVLFPDSSLVEERLTSLTSCLQAETLISVARKRMEQGEMQKAVSAARQAFVALPDAQGLGELLSDLEATSKNSPAVQFEGEYRHDIDLNDGEDFEEYDDTPDSVDDFIERIRQLVRDDRWDEAAILVEQGVSDFPDNELLETFKVKFKRLGFLN